MFVKLKENFDLDTFIHISFGTNGSDSLPYFEWFCIDNLRKPTTASAIGNTLFVKVIDAENQVVELGYENEEDKAIWEVIS